MTADIVSHSPDRFFFTEVIYFSGGLCPLLSLVTYFSAGSCPLLSLVILFQCWFVSFTESGYSISVLVCVLVLHHLC